MYTVHATWESVGACTSRDGHVRFFFRSSLMNNNFSYFFQSLQKHHFVHFLTERLFIKIVSFQVKFNDFKTFVFCFSFVKITKIFFHFSERSKSFVHRSFFVEKIWFVHENDAYLYAQVSCRNCMPRRDICHRQLM